MATRPPRPQAWVPYIALIVLAIGAIYQSGVLSSEVARNREDIVALQASDKARSDAINAMNQRGVRIETKLDIMLGDKDHRP